MLKLTESTRIRVPIPEKRYIRFEWHSREHWRRTNSQFLLGGYSGHQTSIIGRDVLVGFLVGFVLLDLYFNMYVLSIVVCPFVLFSFGHCVVCSSSIYGFWLPLWHLQTLLWLFRNRNYKLYPWHINNNRHEDIDGTSCRYVHKILS